MLHIELQKAYEKGVKEFPEIVEKSKSFKEIENTVFTSTSKIRQEMNNKIHYKPVQANTLEEDIRLKIEQGEPIDNSKAILYQKRNEGINPAYNVRTDRWEIAQSLKSNQKASQTAKRTERYTKKEDDGQDEPEKPNLEIV